MKKIITISTCLLATSLQAATAIDGWYGSVFGGYAFLQSNVSRVINGTSVNVPKYRDGWNAGGRFGYQSNPLRYELELTYTEAATNRFNVAGTPQTGVSGDTSGSFAMMNVYYDFPDFVPSIGPFVGVGIGYARVQSTLKSTGPVATNYFKATDNVFAYQGTAGITYNFAENYAVNLAYRYAATDQGNNLGKRFQANLASLGIVYRFEERYYK